MTAKYPCRCCGVATGQPVGTEVAHDALGRPKAEYDVGLCDDCATLRPDEPGVAVRAALRVLGKPEDDPLAAEAFLEAGVDVGPVLYARSTPQHRAWAHVDREGKAALRAGYARLLDLRVHAAADKGRPVPAHAPPEDTPYRACLACGVARAEQWRGPVTTGAFTRPRMATGYLCPACGDAAEAAGALGPGMLERALLAARGVEHAEGATVPGLRAWASTGQPPHATPWEHVGEVREPEPDLDPVAALQVAVRDLAAQVADLERRLP